MNTVTLLGRLAKDADVRYNQNQMAVARFPIAIDTGYGDKKRTDFPNVVAFGKTAENIEKFTGKGLRVLVQGRLQTGSYEKQDGSKVYTTDVIADRVEFIDWKEKDDSIPQGFQEIDEELPF